MSEYYIYKYPTTWRRTGVLCPSSMDRTRENSIDLWAEAPRPQTRRVGNPTRSITKKELVTDAQQQAAQVKKKERNNLLGHGSPSFRTANGRKRTETHASFDPKQGAPAILRNQSQGKSWSLSQKEKQHCGLHKSTTGKIGLAVPSSRTANGRKRQRFMRDSTADKACQQPYEINHKERVGH